MSNPRFLPMLIDLRNHIPPLFVTSCTSQVVERLPGGPEQVEGHVSLLIIPKIRADLTAGGKFHIVVILFCLF